MAKKNKPEGKKYNFMDTYGDMVTLLLCFFVMLFAVSVIQEDKYNTYVEAISDRFGSMQIKYSYAQTDNDDDFSDDDTDDETGEPMPPDITIESDLASLFKEISDYLDESAMSGSISVDASDDSSRVYIRMDSGLLFDPDSYVIKASAKPVLDSLAQIFLENEDEIFRINFMGHTAALQEGASSVDTQILSAMRASTITSYMVNQSGFSEYKVASQGYGKVYPIADNTMAEGRERNRRVDIVIISNSPETLEQNLKESFKVYFPDDDKQFADSPEEIPDSIIDTTLPTE